MGPISASNAIIQIGQIWTINYPYTSNPVEYKPRPGVIVGWTDFGPDEDELVWVVSITSHGDGGRSRKGEIKVENPDQFGLTEGSYIRARNIYSISTDLFPTSIGPIGTLSDELVVRILKEIAKAITGKKYGLLPR